MFRLMEASSSVTSSRTASRTASRAVAGPPGTNYGADDDDDAGAGSGGPLQRSLSGVSPASRAQLSRQGVFGLVRRLGSSGNAAGSGGTSEPPPPPPPPLNSMLEPLHEDRPSLSSEESPFSVVAEMMSALRAAQQSQQQNAVPGSRCTSQGQDAPAAPFSAGERSSASDRKSPLGKTTSSSHAAGAADGGRGSGGSGRGPSRVPSPQRPLGLAAAGTGSAGAAASSSRYNAVHGSGEGGSGSLSAALMEALGSTTAATRRRGTAAAVATAATAAADAAAVRRRGSNTGALTCFPTSLS